jgi:hypothetical protein
MFAGDGNKENNLEEEIAVGKRDNLHLTETHNHSQS